MPRVRKNTGHLSLNEAFRELKADFRAGKDTRFTSKLTGVSSAGSGADYHYRNEIQFLHMMERARHYQRNDPIVGQGVRRLVSNVVQDGFRLDVNTGDESVDAELKSRWREFESDPDMCHSEGEFTWSQMEQMALSSVIVDGDVILLPLRTGQLQFIEAHRMRTPRNTRRNVVHGVLLNRRAQRREYWITKEDLDPNRPLTRVKDIRPFRARDPEGNRQVFHIYNPYRFSQRRGVTAIAPVSDTVGMHDDLQFATLVKAQMAALIAIFHEKDPDYEPIADQQKGDRETETLEGGHIRTIEGVSAGLEVFGNPGERLSGFSPHVPAPEFFPHANLILTFIAINLDLPVAVLMLDPSETNFSGWRGAIDQARMRFKQMQKWLVESLHTPVYRFKIRQWSSEDPALGRAAERSSIDLFSHRWHAPTFPYIEPLKDAQADLLQQRNALNSARRIQASRGRDWDDVSTEIVEDNRSAIRKAVVAAKELNGEFPDANIHWRELISLPTAEGVSVQSFNSNEETEGQGEQRNPQRNPQRTSNGQQSRFKLPPAKNGNGKWN